MNNFKCPKCNSQEFINGINCKTCKKCGVIVSNDYLNFKSLEKQSSTSEKDKINAFLNAYGWKMD